MGQGGDNNITGDGSFFNGQNLGETILDAATNYMTLGLLGRNRDGSVKAGIVGNAAKEGIGELTGANAAREQNNLTRDAVEAERKQRAADLKASQDSAMRNDIAASQAAAGIKKRAGGRVSGTGDLGTSDVTQTASQDFLGL